MGRETAFRHRHDGWTPVRQIRFCAELARTGCLLDACRAVGLSKTSAYRAYRRMPAFAARWNDALETPRPLLEQAAFERAVNGVEEPVVSAGKVVAVRRRYSNALLRFLLEREDRMRGTPAERECSDAEAEAALLKQLDGLALRLKRQAEREAGQAAAVRPGLPPPDRVG